MGYEPHQLSVLAYANNFTMWHYNHEGKHEEVIKDNFFVKAQDMLRKGDLMIINCQDADTSVWVKQSETGTVIVKENLLPVGA